MRRAAPPREELARAAQCKGVVRARGDGHDDALAQARHPLRQQAAAVDAGDLGRAAQTPRGAKAARAAELARRAKLAQRGGAVRELEAQLRRQLRRAAQSELAVPGD